MEEELVLSMLHKDQGISGSLIGVFESSLALESFGQCCLEVLPLGRCVEEAKFFLGPGLQDHSPFVFNMSSKELGFEELAYSGPKCPPGFENFIGVVGFSDRAQVQCVSMKNLSMRILWRKGMKLIRVLGSLMAPFQIR